MTDHIITRLRRNATDCENMERWAVPELAPLLREAAESIDLMRTALMLTKSDMRHALREIDRELDAVDGKTPADAPTTKTDQGAGR